MNEEDLRDCFAMFAIVGLLNRGDTKNLRAATELAYECADNMLEARKPKEKDDEEDTGIASVAKRSYRRKS
jgi:hypothetical protein